MLATLVAPEKRAMPSQSWRQDYAPRPIISHQFRKPDKRPASVISVAFAGTALVPLALLLVGLQHIKVNLKVSQPVLNPRGLKIGLLQHFAARAVH